MKTTTSTLEVTSEPPKAHLKHLSQSYMTKVKAIAESRLAEWQKLEAIQWFIRPTLDYTLRTMLPMKKWARDIDNHTRQVIKKAFHLPKTTCTPTLHYAWKSDSLGLLCIVDDLHIVWVSQTFKFLTNKDIYVKSVAVEQLRATVKARARCSAPTPENTLQFLDAWRETPTYQSDIRSLWSILPWSC